MHALALWLIAGFLRGEPLTANATCTPVVGKGRLRCTLEITSVREIRWAEFVVKDAPPIADPLRGRMGPLDAALRTGKAWKWEFAFAGVKKGEGNALIEVRAVTCEGEHCEPETKTFPVSLRVD